MGFAVHCTGADLLERLKRDEDSLLGRRYPLYIIALATEVDDEAIQWLADYGRAMDSLTGEQIAFIVFYNSLCFRTTSPGGLRTFITPVDTEGTKKVFRYNLPKIDVPPKALQGAWALRKHVAGKMRFPDEAFVTSMTYQSDQVARALGIKPKELPCLVYLDNPDSDNFYVLHIESYGKELLTTVRGVVGDYYSNPDHKAYFDLVRRWDACQMDLVEYAFEGFDVERAINQSTRSLAGSVPTRHEFQVVKISSRSSQS